MVGAPGGGDVNMGLLVNLLLGEERPDEEAGEKCKPHGVRADRRGVFSIHATADRELLVRLHRLNVKQRKGWAL